MAKRWNGIRRGARGGRNCLGIVVTIITVVCAPSPDTARFTVDYYRSHAPERDAKVTECSNDPGGKGKTPDCVNAIQAAQLEGVGSLRNLPPVGLNEAPPKAEDKPTQR